MNEHVDWFALIASERGMPDGWKWNTSRVIDAGFLVGGAVCTALFQSGPRKGKLNWSKRDRDTEKEIFISRDALRERKERWERETGKCHECYGTGQVFAGWSAAEGTRHKPCCRCKATGTAPKETP